MKTFYPKKSILIPASDPHPKNTQYKISIGNENWNDEYVDVIKVQMVYDGKIAGRTSPSYPNDSDDEKRVKHIIEVIKGGCRISLSKDLLFNENGDIEKRLNDMLMKYSDYLSGYSKETYSDQQFFFIIYFKPNILKKEQKEQVEKIISCFKTILKDYGIDGKTDFIEIYFGN